jgi:AcrR family transcriptional regulator
MKPSRTIRRREVRRGGSAGRAPSRRGIGTRNHLIETAIDVFGEYGFEAATTRMLAQRAGVNLAAIPYHFGGKAGLYRAAAQFIADHIESRMRSVFEQADAALRAERAERAELLRILHALLETFATVVIASNEGDNWSGFVIREQMRPGEAFEILYQGVMERVHGMCAALVAQLLGEPGEDAKTNVRALMILGQILIFRMGRTAALRRLGWKRFTDERVEFVKAVMREQVDAIVARSAPQQS